jgi:hypothetical protein
MDRYVKNNYIHGTFDSLGITPFPTMENKLLSTDSGYRDVTEFPARNPPAAIVGA